MGTGGSRLATHSRTSAGSSASEQRWIDLFDRYLPRRYRASPAFVVDADGGRCRQIDIAIYDNLYSPLIFSPRVRPAHRGRKRVRW